MDWNRILLGDSFDGWLIAELVARVLIMFVVLLLCLRLTGKRSVNQLSILELIILIALSTAAGDPMYMQEAAIVPGAIVILAVVGALMGLNYLTREHPRTEKFVEGESEVVVFSGRLNPDVLKRELVSQREFFARLRSHGYSHLGQINSAILEFTGALTIYPYADNQVQPGLPLLDDELFEKSTLLVERSHILVCADCGANPTSENKCSTCENDRLVEAWTHPRAN